MNKQKNTIVIIIVLILFMISYHFRDKKSIQANLINIKDGIKIDFHTCENKIYIVLYSAKNTNHITQ